ncbi:dynein axonemal heavy chain 3-like [Leptopilina boulardi]|uniref:dynein axonemal heavy chain 3-like n=1 Tax=Leptopilina boulardi TaxID=63433 RepID=UPI0021F5A41F|nr:dynein axonemal heavy chain 3-like [Leptopilina boulardi]
MKSESEDELQREITILNLEIDQLIPEFVILDDMDDAKRVQDYREYLQGLVRKMHQIEKKIYQINFEERLFKFPETNFPKDMELREVIEPFSALVQLICEWQRDHEVWLKGPFEYLDATVIERKTKYFHQEISESNKTFKSKIKMDVTANKAYKFSGIVDDPDPMQQPAPLKLCWQVLKDINNFINFVPLAICFCNPALRKRHWNEMSSVSGFNLQPNAGTTLKTFEEICQTYCLNENVNFKLKLIQIYEMIYARDGIIIIGEPLAGKSTVLKILREILILIKEQIILETINPGAISIDQLYGYYNKITKTWKDGIFLKIFRDKLKKWIIFDGPINNWIENLYSLLDDNRTLILNSHEKLTKSSEMKFFIETLDLEHVSPLTISRFGIINIQIEDWRNYLKPLIKNLEIKILENYEIIVYSLFDWTIDTCVKFIEKNCQTIVKVNNIHLVMSTFNLFRILLREALIENSFEKGKQEYLMSWVQAIFIISTIWSLSGTLDTNSLKLFNSFYLSLWNSSTENRPNCLKQIEMSFPNEGLLTDYIYIFKGTGSWKHCSDLMKNEKILENPGFKDIFIPTVHSMKYSLIFQKHVNQKKPFILCSDETLGKTSLLQDLFSNKLPETFTTNNFHFTSRITGQKAQRLFLSKLIKRKRDDYGPLKQFCINFIDNFNCDYFLENNSTLELLRQFFDYGHWYDIENSKIFIHDTTFIMEMNKINKNICRRFLRHFNIYMMHIPCKESIFKIFTNLLFLNLKKNSFAMDVMPSLNGIVNATIEFYFSIKENLKPIPDKLQYIFSLKDISRIIRGCSIVQRESVETKITFIRLWVHEVFRVFADRIIDENDENWFFLKLKECVKSNFKDSFESVFDHLPKSKHDELTSDSFKFLHFGNFMDEKNDSQKYEEINSMENLLNKVNSFISDYNAENKIKLDIVISRFIIEHLIRICRIMSIPGENLLMICSSGFGRKSLIRLASFMEKQNLFEPNLDFYYNLESWRRDLKSLFKNCASKNEDYTILVTDRDLKDEFLDDVMSLLETGQIPELFNHNDEREIVNKVRLAAQNGNRNLELTISEVLDYFTKECKKKLHLIVCLSWINFTKLGKNFPLTKSCTINYLSSWPKETFEKVSKKFLKEVPMKEEIKTEIIVCFQFFHTNIVSEIEKNLKIQITPTIFVRHVKLYRKIILAKQKELKIAKSKYMSCLEKLKLASNQVDQMKKVLMTLRPQLESSAEQTRITMEEVENENLAVEKATIIVKDEEKIANDKAEIAGKLRTECETDLAVAIPILEDAISALNTLKPADITLVKAMKNPPDTVKLVMAAVCVMLDVPSERILDPVTGKKSSDYWGPSKRVLGDMNFLQNLKDYDKDNISPSIMQIIKNTYMTDKSFLPHIVAKASSAAEGLCKWVRAMVSYDEVAKAVAPKKEKLALAQKECDDAEAYLTEKRETLADLNERLANLKTSLETVLAKKQELEKEVADCTDRLQKAESLLTSLGGEKSRWIRCTDNLQKSFNSLPGDILLASGLIVYLSSFILPKRELFLQNWTQFVKDHKIPISDNFQFTKILASENQFYSWYLSHLVENPFIHQNAVIMDISHNWCLFIDPQNQAKQWIKNLEKDLIIIKSYDKNCIDTICNCIKLGKPILIENFQILQAWLDPIFYCSTYMEEEKIYIEIKNEKIPYSEKFRFYITGTISKITTEIFNRVTLVNFTFPEEALTENLLDIVIAKENYQIQDNYEKLLSELSHDKMALNREEEKVLNILSTSNVNILEDKKALKILDSSKNTSIDILKRNQTTIKEKNKIELFRQGYREFAQYSAQLYSIIKSLANLHQMYIFSLPWYYQLYTKSIEISKRSTILQKRLGFLKFQITKKLHSSVKNTLCEKDKLIFSFILCLKMLQVKGNISQDEINAFWKIEINLEKQWNREKFEEIIFQINSNLGENFRQNLQEWKNYFHNPRESIIKEMNFEKLIIMKIIRPDRILVSIIDFIETTLGNLEVKTKFQTCDISLGFDESTCLSPLIFILPSHVSILPIIFKFATQKRCASKLLSLSLDEDQTEKAEFLIKDAQKNEKWLFLENCHLAQNWLPKLEKIIENFNATNTSLGFRLWLSTLPTDKFPPSILQSGIKISCDTPIGLRENLLSIYISEPVSEKKFFDGCPGKDKIFSKLLYSLSFFHVILKKRKYYDHRGWNLNYNFNQSDFSLSAIQLQSLINTNQEIPFQPFLHLINECSYGSKITNQFDRKRLGIFIDDFFNPKINEPFYSFSHEVGFSMPRRHEYNDYIKQIMEIGNDCNPEFFGLDESGEVIKNLKQVKNFQHSFNVLNEIEFDVKIEMKMVLEIIYQIREKMKKRFDVEEIKVKYPISYKEPLHGILIHEIEIFNFILTYLENSFCDIENAYSGNVMWKTEFYDLSKNLILNFIPEFWKTKLNITTCLISTFIENLRERINFLENWINHGNPKSFNLGLLDSSKALLIAIKMTFARIKNLSIEDINFNFEITSTFELTNSIDFQFYGLLLQGGRWNIDKKILENNFSNTIWHQMPLICLKEKIKCKDNFKLNDRYNCPLYKVPYQRNCENYLDDENNFIIKIPLLSEIDEKYWIKKGTALYCRKE